VAIKEDHVAPFPRLEGHIYNPQ
jgi:PadR family transcriptional regulator, regulatory protein PadR